MAAADDPPPRKRGRGADTERTKAALIDAAFETLRDDGFAGVTARSVADRARANQAAIYYHFGGIEPLLLAALERSGAERLVLYEEALSGPLTLVELIDRLELLYRQDRATGHIRVLTQLVAGAVTNPSLVDGIRAVTGPWTTFVEERITSTVSQLTFGNVLSAADLTELVFSLVIGMETRSQFEEQPGLADRLFTTAKVAARLIAPAPAAAPGEPS